MQLQLENLSGKLITEEKETSRLRELNLRNETQCAELLQSLKEERSIRQQTEESNSRMKSELINSKAQVLHLILSIPGITFFFPRVEWLI